MKLRRAVTFAFLAAALVLATPVCATPVQFNFTFTDSGSGAMAEGTITFEDTLVANPGQNLFFPPDPAVLELNVTVSNASSGNGTFTIGDFSIVIFETNGGTLNFAAELVGQPTNGQPWGTQIGGGSKGGEQAGDAGDFNLVSGGPVKTGGRYEDHGAPTGTGPMPPTGLSVFLLVADGGNAEAMSLISMAPSGAAAPAPAPVSIAIPTLANWGSAILVLMLIWVAAAKGKLLKMSRFTR